MNVFGPGLMSWMICVQFKSAMSLTLHRSLSGRLIADQTMHFLPEVINATQADRGRKVRGDSLKNSVSIELLFF